MAKQLKLARDARGNFKRQMGKKLTKGGDNLFDPGDLTPPTFYLGKDEAAACINVLRLEQVWDAIHERWYRQHDTPCALWDETTYAIGKAVAAGQTRVEVEYPYPELLGQADHLQTAEEAVSAWITDLRDQFAEVDGLELVIADERLRAATAEHVEKQIDRAEAAATRARKARDGGTGPKLREALAAYADRIKAKYISPEDGMPTGHAALIQRRLTHIERVLGPELDKPLSALGSTFLETWLDVWANRPLTEAGTVSSVSWCQGCIKTIRAFVRWLNGSDLFQWEKPRGYEERTTVTVRQTSDELEAEEIIPRYNREQVGILWQYGNPRDRVFLLLGLNCGFGLGEIATLRTRQIFERGDRSFIKRKRRKTGIWGRWELWPETAAALKWYQATVRPRSDSPYVFLTGKGRPLADRTNKGNPTMVIPNQWDRLYERIIKDHPEFPKLSFNKCRKTGATFVRAQGRGPKDSDIAAWELADLFLAHGKKSMADRYSPRMFRPVTRALRRIHRRFKPLFAAVADPFPADQPRAANVILPQSKIRRIQELRRQGYTIKKIAELVGVTTQTVCRYVPRVGKGHRQAAETPPDAS